MGPWRTGRPHATCPSSATRRWPRSTSDGYVSPPAASRWCLSQYSFPGAASSNTSKRLEKPPVRDDACRRSRSIPRCVAASSFPPNVAVHGSNQEKVPPRTEYAHVDPLGVDRSRPHETIPRGNRMYPQPGTTGNSRPVGMREKHVGSEEYSATLRPNFEPQGSGMPFRRPRMVDPATMESLRRSLYQQHRLSTLAPPERRGNILGPERLPASSPDPVEMNDGGMLQDDVHVPSRSSSQRRALHKFEKELEKFAKISAPRGRKVIATPTVSETPLSLDTIQEFMPYRSQFQAAGLAVTSADQRSPRKHGKAAIQKIDVGRGKPLRLHLDGGNEHTPSSQSPTSTTGDTAIYFHDPEVMVSTPTEVARGKSRRFQADLASRPVLPWLKKKSTPVEGKQQNHRSHWRAQTYPRPTSSPRDKPLPRKPVLRRSTGTRHFGVEKSLPPPPPPPSPPERKRPKPPGSKRPAIPRESSCVELSGATNESRGPDPRTVERVVWLERDKCLPPLPIIGRGSMRKRRDAARSSRTTYSFRTRPHPTAVEEIPKPAPSVKKGSQSHTKDSTKASTKPSTKPGVLDQEVRLKENGSRNRNRPSISTTPSLPKTWKHAVSTPLSLEQALDDVVRKLDELEDRNIVEVVTEGGGTQKSASSRKSSLSPSLKLQKAAAMRQKRMGDHGPPNLNSASAPSAAPRSARRPGPDLVTETSASVPSSSAADSAVDYEDRDIHDRDVLKGLRLAVLVACDEKVDAWIRKKTGLRLRRFLADLKTFESLHIEMDLMMEEQAAERRKAEKRRGKGADQGGGMDK
jgi:hypothetical protein